jgi:tRNA pseudouridine55 synthase
LIAVDNAEGAGLPDPRLSGLLAVNKPRGMISKDVSRWLIQRLGRVKIGHVGTLDPLAEGVLPILFGTATRIQDHLLALSKSYTFEVTLGRATETADAEGPTILELPWDHVSEADLRNAARAFEGRIEQLPPIYSAVKFEGRPLYEYARKNREAEVPLETLKRQVTIERCELTSFSPPVARFEVDCSQGTYVRSLAQDLAEKVGTCGMVSRLIRTRAAGIPLSKALTLETIEAKIRGFSDLVIPLEQIDLGLSRWRAQDEDVWVARLLCGQQVILPREEFQRGHSGATSPEGASDHGESLLLLDQNGVAFGLGIATLHQSGGVQLVMKRGLR